MGSSKIKTVDMSVKVDSDTIGQPLADQQASEAEETKRVPKGRSKTYTSVKGLVDRTKFYKLETAVGLLKRLSYSSFAGTVSVDATVKDEKLNLETTFPHATGKVTRVAIADEATLEAIAQGKLDFDVLIATPDMMPKIARHAKALGPRGLMPNPKNKTVTDNPEKRKKELEAGSVAIKAERKFPLIHVVVGKTSQPDSELVANIAHLIKVIGPRQLKKLTVSATMSPGVKIDLSEFQTI